MHCARVDHFCVAVVQAAPVLFDTPESIQKLSELATEAAKGEA